MEFAAGVYKSILFPVIPTNTGDHLSELQKAMLDATPDCIKILSVDGRLLMMNRAGCKALGVPEDSEFGMLWLPLLPPGVHQSGLEALRTAATGQSARFPGQSHSPKGTQHWDNLLTPVVDTTGNVFSILCVSRDVTAKTELERDLENAVSREKLLSQEMQHRIKNVFAIVSALITISEKEAGRDDASQSATKILRAKIGALSRASEVAFPLSEIKNVANSRLDIGSLVHSVLKPYGNRYSASGSQTSVRHKNLTTIALFLHELATNSVKYGAFSSDEGAVSINWAMNDQELSLLWSESGGPPILTEPREQGFGSEMVGRIVGSVGGRISRTWSRDGMIAQLHLPNSDLA
ncbi:MAG: PAS domain-containing protein [Hyphomicrobium sp.]|uniref:PAS domain-containing protein n=1 Tax=Hyphomicrobium sp. TaxID=82 RepID=UPI0039E23EAF